MKASFRRWSGHFLKQLWWWISRSTLPPVKKHHTARHAFHNCLLGSGLGGILKRTTKIKFCCQAMLQNTSPEFMTRLTRQSPLTMRMEETRQQTWATHAHMQVKPRFPKAIHHSPTRGTALILVESINIVLVNWYTTFQLFQHYCCNKIRNISSLLNEMHPNFKWLLIHRSSSNGLSGPVNCAV